MRLLCLLALGACGGGSRDGRARQPSPPDELVTADTDSPSNGGSGTTAAATGDTGGAVETGAGGSDTADTAAALQILRVDVLDAPALVLQKILEVETNVQSTTTLRCTADLVALEDHRVADDVMAHVHPMRLNGLLGGISYRCTVTATAPSGQDSREVVVPISPLPFDPPVLTPALAPGADPEGAYTIFNHWSASQPQTIYVVDPQGRIRWYWRVPGDPSVGIEAVLAWPGMFVIGGGRGLNPRLVDQWGLTRWVNPEPTSQGVHHHDASLTPLGDVLGLATARNTLGNETWEGFLVETVTPYDDTVTLSWNSQLAVDAGQLPPRNGPFDAYHANAVSWVEDADGAGFVVSLAELNQIVRVDPAGGILWKLGVGGDFQLIDKYGVPVADPSRWFYYQHAPKYDGARRRMLIHDNGKGRPGPEAYSRGVELELDMGAMTAQFVWQYREAWWYERWWGDVAWLPNGHILLAEGHNQSQAGAHPGFRSKILQIDPATNTIVHSLTFTRGRDSLYRADRIDGCDLFRNAGYCPSL